MVDDERKVGVRSFQTRGLETAKLRDPDVIVFVITRLRLDIALAYTASAYGSPIILHCVSKNMWPKVK